MKNILNILLIALAAFNTLKADAVALTDVQVKKIIAKQITEDYKQHTDADLEVKVVAVPFADLDLPDGKLSVQVTPSADRFMPRDLNKVEIYVDGRLIKTFNAPTVTKAYRNVLVASKVIEREKTINSSVVKIEKREVSNIFDYVLTPDASDKEIMAKKYFATGEIIDKRFVKIKPDVLRNSIVTVFFNSSNLTITLDAIALSDGIVGDSICIMNKQYNKIYKGRIVAENKVLVQI